MIRPNGKHQVNQSASAWFRVYSFPVLTVYDYSILDELKKRPTWSEIENRIEEEIEAKIDARLEARIAEMFEQRGASLDQQQPKEAAQTGKQ